MTATLYGPMDAPRGLGMPAWHSAAEWESSPGSDRPVYYGDWYQFPLAADASPDLKRRSEIKPGPSEDAVRVQVGMHSRFDGVVLPRLGPAGTQTRNWHCVAQLIGPNYDGQWVGGASVALIVRDGRWVICSGDQSTWVVDLGPYVDNIAQTCKIEVELHEIATLGRVSVQLGNMSQSNLEVPTFWHRYLQWSCGIYRGSGNSPYSPTYVNSDGSTGGPQPTAAQTVFWKNINITNSWPPV